MQVQLLEEQNAIFNEIVKEVKESLNNDGRINHTIISGIRGAGKTTLLQEIFEKLLSDEETKKRYILISLPFSYRKKGIEEIFETVLLNTTNLEDKKIIVFVDDLHVLLNSSDREAHQLRKLLLRKKPSISLIATVDTSFENLLSHSKALYGFLRIRTLSDELTDDDISYLLKDIIPTKQWMRLNEKLCLSNTFWFMGITSSNLRLVMYLIYILKASETEEVEPTSFIKSFYSLAEVHFDREMKNLPMTSRGILELASRYGKDFQLGELGIDNKNIWQYASKLVELGYLVKKERGFYSFKMSALKAWFRYMANLPFGRVLNPDIPVSTY